MLTFLTFSKFQISVRGRFEKKSKQFQTVEVAL